MIEWLREQLKNNLSKLHRPIYQATAGRIGGRAFGIPTLLLTTTGRKSGQARTWPLLYFRNRGRYVIIASNWGQHRHPAWIHNLRADPHATIEIGGEQIDVVAEEVTGEERERLWHGAARAFPAYEQYRSRTSREIPVVVLTIE